MRRFRCWRTGLKAGRDVSRLSVLEPQGFRPPAEDEIFFTAFNHRGGEIMGVHLETGEIRNYSQSPWFDEADGVFPDGRSTLVTREFARVFIPRDLDLWRLALDGSAHWRRLTRFNRYAGYGVSNSAVSPDGRHVVFQLRRSDGPLGNGLGLLLLDLEATAPRQAGPESPGGASRGSKRSLRVNPGPAGQGRDLELSTAAHEESKRAPCKAS